MSQLLPAQVAEVRKVVDPGFTTIVPNEGQWDGAFYNKTELGYGNLFTDDDGYKMILWNGIQKHKMMEEYHLYKNLKNTHVIDFCALHFTFIEANEVQVPEYKIPASWQEGYYMGDDPEKWAPRVQPYYTMVKKNVYPGIHFQHSTIGNYAKSEWHAQPNSDPNLIQIAMDGADSIRLISNQLIIYTPAGNLIEKAPVAWQIREQQKWPVQVRYVLTENILSFELGAYDSKYPLVIDPVLVFSTYSGSVSDNFGFTATYDSKGRLYAGGISGKTSAGGKYPTTPGAFQDTFRGGTNTAPINLQSDITLSKYSSDGTTLLYATYFGGSRNDLPHSLVVNEQDELYVLGTSFSTNFPTKKAYDNSHNGNADIVLFHFNEDCSQLLNSTYIGGGSSDGLNAPTNAGTLGYNYADDFRGDIFTDAHGHVYVATCTNSGNFPTTDSALQKTKNGNRDAVVFSLDSNLSRLRFSTFWGGSSDDAAYSVKINSEGNVFVGGGTASSDFQSLDTVYLDTYQGGVADGFILMLDSVYGKITKSTLFGTSVYDQIYFLDIDEKDRVYAAGQTEGNLVRTAGTYGKDNTSQFIAAFDKELRNLQFQTTFGNRLNNPELSPSAFLVDNCFNIYYSGWGSAIGGHPGTTEGLETKNANWAATDEQDFYLIVMNKEARGLVYASYIGGTSSGDHVDGGTSRFDKNGIVYQSVCASCPPPGTSQLSDFPTSTTSAFPTNPSERCSNASFKLDFQITYFTEAKFNAPPRLCLGKTVQFNNTGQGTSFNWDFGDGSTDTARDPSHTYQKSGIFTVTLITIDSLSCNLADTTQGQIEILEGPTAGFTIDYNPCERGKVTFTNTSSAGQQVWDYDDGSQGGDFEETHFYEQDGQFNIQQIVSLPNGCADTFVKQVILSSQAGGAIKLYNVFTPNGDVLNPCWFPDGINTECEEVIFYIYSRNGTRVFSSKTDGNCWNGELANAGKELTEGTYYSIIDIKRKDTGEERKVYGVITLVR